jgi:hypothetical protein
MEQKYRNEPMSVACSISVLLASGPATRCDDTCNSGTTISCSAPSPLTMVTWTMSPSWTGSTGLTLPSMAPPFPMKTILPCAMPVRRVKDAFGMACAMAVMSDAALDPAAATGYDANSGMQSTAASKAVRNGHFFKAHLLALA